MVLKEPAKPAAPQHTLLRVTIALLVILLFVVLLAVALLFRGKITPVAARIESSQEVATLRGRLAEAQSELGARFGHIGDRTKELVPPAGLSLSSVSAEHDLLERIAVLEKNTPSDLPQRLDSFALKSEQSELSERVAKLESQNIEAVLHKAAAAVAFAGLLRSSDTSGDFSAQLRSFRALMPDVPEATDLAKHATGAPTVAMLAVDFPEVADDIMTAERLANAQGLSDRIWVQLARFVEIRRLAHPAGGDTESRLVRAGDALAANDLDDALREMQRLDKPARMSAAAWIMRGQARQAVNHDIAVLSDRLTALLASP